MVERVASKKGKGETKILQVTYQAPSPDKAQHVMSALSKAYIQYSFSERKTNLRRAIQFVDNQLPKVETQVRKFEQELQTFRERYRLLDPASLGGQISGQTGEIQKQIHFEKLANATAITVDEKNQKLYFLTANEIGEISL